jgi:uncharacterized heparinase superfamily protein
MSIPHRYPQHLRPSLDAMPQAPGVYTFHGQEGDLPLYIGKSVALRSRILSHLRDLAARLPDRPIIRLKQRMGSEKSAFRCACACLS